MKAIIRTKDMAGWHDMLQLENYFRTEIVEGIAYVFVKDGGTQLIKVISPASEIQIIVGP
jgi:hypothetical protein